LLRGYAAIIGVYGVTFFVALSAALIVATIIQMKKRNYFVWVGYLVVLILIWVIGGELSTIQWTQPTSKAIKVSIIQGNIPQQIKWSPDQIIPTIQRYINLTKPYWQSKIILWPEAAIPLPLPNAQNIINQLAARAKKHHTSLILGIPIRVNSQYYNAAIAIGAGSGKYYKQRLVPFGEYVPFENILRGLFAFFDLPMSDFVAGPKNQAPLLANNVPVAPYICYEVAYDSLVRQDLPQAQILITISDDAWFGQSIAAEQHLQIGQMRCLETGRYMLFSTNNGVTAIINPQGKIVQRIARFKPGVLTNKIYPMKNATPYVIAGSWPIILGCLILGLISLTIPVIPDP
jgi:apolipoprotein N-acyltransferase